MIRIVTWNIGGAYISRNRDHWFDTQDLDYFARELDRLQCDIVCLQEVHDPIDKHSDCSQIERMSDLLDMPFYRLAVCDNHKASHLSAEHRLAVAILSRFSILSAHYYELPNPEISFFTASGREWISHDKGFLRVNLEVGALEISVITGHTIPFSVCQRDFLDPELRHIRGSIEDLLLQSATDPTLVAGDFNYELIECLLPRVFELGFTRAFFEGGTEPIMGRQIDHILASNHWEIVHSATVPGKADHYLCYADVSWSSQMEVRAGRNHLYK